MSNALIHAEGMKVGYDGRCVVEGVDIHALRGSMTCLLGPNGAGKSTILRTLSGMLAPVEGTVFVDGSRIGDISKGALARRLAVVLTDKFSPGLTTVFEIAAMGRHPYTGFFGKLKERDRQIVEEALRSVNALELSERYYGELSDGEKQKVMIARALAQEPELIVLDEPTSHLDIRHRIEVVSILARLCKEKGITVILSLHDIDLALKGCENVLMVKDGRVVCQGAPEQIVTPGTVQALYGIEGARYDDLLGSLELKGGAPSRAFVVGGGGSAVPVYRALRRMGVGMDTGVLHPGDVDYHVAQGICNRIVCAQSFEAVSPAQREEALALAKGCRVVVDCGFAEGEMNRENIALVRMAAQQGQIICAIGERNSAAGVHHFESAYALAQGVERILKGEQA